MASSSLSQEDFENEYELSTRRSRIRAARANARNVPPSRSEPTGPTADADDGPGGYPGQADHGDAADHEASPKPAVRSKDKRCPRPNHVNKGKAQRERRKLREKRRSTGVVHLPSTESTGGSTGEDEEELLMSAETRRNTNYNEAQVEKDHSGASENIGIAKTFPQRINKSPSDLDADDEDNQDYDSAVNQSDSTVSLVQEPVDSPRSVQNGRPETPCTENLEELLERAQEENHHLLNIVKEKDDKIAFLEQKINSLNRVSFNIFSKNKQTNF
ncbi:PRKC apoptosis WT1 regulator protein-like [Centruroides sculpturatus]|uniref:PRKC apoptosis WT1 regulator protein-like n=1 Tax=Centruroides sculpturatus TaxID=218467 RepID=UPI000C6D5B39|nr:PRKC apoptosis WT1 regulator protein-like [Centruroides sculpturatus]